MLLGIDFDNTIVCYDQLFRAVALEKGWISTATLAGKDAVRNQLRAQGQEEDWIWLQGEIYGARILEAAAFPGVLDFFGRCRANHIPVRIISHKTRHPFKGEKHDLHHAALNWLKNQGFFDEARIALSPRDVHLELTKADKLQCIASAGCSHFIDDLPEFLAEPAFPAGVQRILFDPADQHSREQRYPRARSWDQMDACLSAKEPQA